MNAEKKILHVASFKGNIGDNANHLGFYNNLKEYVPEFTINEFEIRETFRGNSSFGRNFVDLCNMNDMVIFGGGNFFELWVNDSETGCSINIAPELVREINVPIVFNSLGVDPGQGADEGAVTKFRAFLDECLDRPNCILSVRNDGAYDNLLEHVGQYYADSFFDIYDAGFDFVPEQFAHPELTTGKENILIQLAGDMQEVRFRDSEISYSEYISGLAEVINLICLDLKANVILCPHIFRDFEIISTLLDRLDDKVRRDFVTVAPCLQGNIGAHYLFDLYRRCDLVMAMRFHANVCSLALGKKTIGLVNYLQIENLYSSIGIDDYVDVRKADFPRKLARMIETKIKPFYKQVPPTLPKREYDAFMKAVASNLV